jgi:hypothetical protein
VDSVSDFAECALSDGSAQDVVTDVISQPLAARCFCCGPLQCSCSVTAGAYLSTLLSSLSDTPSIETVLTIKQRYWSLVIAMQMLMLTVTIASFNLN